MIGILSYFLALGPYIAVALFLAIVLVGFAPWAWKHPERWLFWAIFLLSFGGIGDSSADGSLYKQVTWGVFFGLLGALLLFSPKANNTPLHRLLPTGLLLLICLMFISIAWSPEPFVSFKRVVQAVGVLLIGLLTARHALLGHKLQTQLQPSAMFFLGIGLCVVVLVPSVAFDADHALRGISPHKNTWGQFSLISSLVFLFAWLDNRCRLGFYALVLVVSVASLVLSRSTTSILAFVVVAGALIVWQLSNRQGVLGKIFLVGVVFTMGLAFHIYLVFTGVWPLDALSDGVFHLAGKEQTLTGRKLLWQLMFAEIEKHPWLGTGYGGFWINGPGASATLISKLNWGPPTQAHSGYIDIVNEIGILGAVLLVGVLFKHLLNIIKLVRVTESYRAVFHGALLFSVLIINYAESSLLRTNHFWWVIICASIFEVHVLTYFCANDSVVKSGSFTPVNSVLTNHVQS